MMMIRRSCCPPSATYEVLPRFRLTSLMTGGRWLLQVFTGYGYTDPDVKLMAHAAWSWEEPRYDFDMQVAITNPSSTQVTIHYAQVRIHPAVTYTSQSCSGAQAVLLRIWLCVTFLHTSPHGRVYIWTADCFAETRGTRWCSAWTCIDGLIVRRDSPLASCEVLRC